MDDSVLDGVGPQEPADYESCQRDGHGCHAGPALSRPGSGAIIFLVHRFVDSGPVVREHLDALRDQYEPKIDELNAAIADAAPTERDALRRELRSLRRHYHAARWKLFVLRRGGIVHW